MSPLPTRRRLLTGVGGVLALGAIGSTVYHGYTGPVTLVIENYVRERLQIEVGISRDSSPVHEATYEISAFTPTDDRDASGSGRIEEQFADSVTRGTTYTVEASTGTNDLAPVEGETYQVTCTGYADIERSNGTEKRLMDKISLSISSDAGVQLDGPYCGSVW